MGDPTTWAILSMLNLFCGDLAKALSEGLDPIEAFGSNRFKHPLQSIVGDDGLIGGPLPLMETFKKVYTRAGQKASQGKEFLSQTTVVLAEDPAVRWKIKRRNSYVIPSKRGIEEWGTFVYLDVPKPKVLFPTPDQGDHVAKGWIGRGAALSGQLRYLEETYDESRGPLKSLAWRVWGARLNRLITENLPVWVPTSLGGLGWPHYKGPDFSWRKRAPARHKRMIRKLLGMPPSPGKALFFGWCANLLTPPKKGLAGEGDEPELLVFLMDRLAGFEGFPTLNVVETRIEFPDSTGPWVDGWIPGKILEEEYSLEHPEPEEGPRDGVPRRAWVAYATQKGYLTPHSLLQKLRRQWSFTRFLSDGVTEKPGEVTVRKIARGYNLVLQEMESRAVNDGLDWKGKSVDELVGAAIAAQTQFWIHETSRQVRELERHYAALNWPMA